MSSNQKLPPLLGESTDGEKGRYYSLGFVRGSYMGEEACALCLGTLIPRGANPSDYSLSIYDRFDKLLLWSAVDEDLNSVEFALTVAELQFGVSLESWHLYPTSLLESIDSEQYHADYRRLEKLKNYYEVQAIARSQIPVQFRCDAAVKESDPV